MGKGRIFTVLGGKISFLKRVGSKIPFFGKFKPCHVPRMEEDGVGLVVDVGSGLGYIGWWYIGFFAFTPRRLTILRIYHFLQNSLLYAP